MFKRPIIPSTARNMAIRVGDGGSRVDSIVVFVLFEATRLTAPLNKKRRFFHSRGMGPTGFSLHFSKVAPVAKYGKIVLY
jgi:hypothetical protein